MASDWQRLGRRCVRGATGDLLGAVLYWLLGLELIDMTIQLAADDGDFYGLPCDSVSSSNAGGKCVTAGETAP